MHQACTNIGTQPTEVTITNLFVLYSFLPFDFNLAPSVQACVFISFYLIQSLTRDDVFDVWSPFD